MHVYEVTPGIKLISLVTSVNSKLKLVISVECLYLLMMSNIYQKIRLYQSYAMKIFKSIGGSFSSSPVISTRSDKY